MCAMISAEQNELMTRVGPGTPGGSLLRNYWQPVALVDELQGKRPVRPVKHHRPRRDGQGRARIGAEVGEGEGGDQG